MKFHTGLIIPITFIFGSISWRFIISTIVLNWMKNWSVYEQLKPFVAIHLFRYISLSLMIPNLTTVNEILTTSQVWRLAAGDVLSSILAMCSLLCLHRHQKIAFWIILLLNIVGLADLGMATLYDVPQFVEQVQRVDARLFAVLTTFIPLVFVSHVFMVKFLWKNRKEMLFDNRQLRSL